MERINPIAWVRPISNLTATSSGYTYTVGNYMNPTAPGSFEWLDQDVSSSDAGRTEDAVMHKELITNAVKCNLSWNYRYIQEVQSVLRAFHGEYFEVCVYDPDYGEAENNYMKVYVMYKGDRSVKMYNTSRGLSESLSFNIIDTCITPKNQFQATASSQWTILYTGKFDGTSYYEVSTFGFGDRIKLILEGNYNLYHIGVRVAGSPVPFSADFLSGARVSVEITEPVIGDIEVYYK